MFCGQFTGYIYFDFYGRFNSQLMIESLIREKILVRDDPVKNQE